MGDVYLNSNDEWVSCDTGGTKRIELLADKHDVLDYIFKLEADLATLRETEAAAQKQCNGARDLLIRQMGIITNQRAEIDGLREKGADVDGNILVACAGCEGDTWVPPDSKRTVYGGYPDAECSQCKRIRKLEAEVETLREKLLWRKVSEERPGEHAEVDVWDDDLKRAIETTWYPSINAFGYKAGIKWWRPKSEGPEES